MSPTLETSVNVARSSARLAAVQGLYQMDIAGTDLNDVITERLEYKFEDSGSGDVDITDAPARDDESRMAPDPTFMSEILRGVVRRQRDIDPVVDGQLAKGWRLGRVDSTLRAILRAAVFELIERQDVPARVIINEYVEIATAFFDGQEPKVVNGILDALARRYRTSEFP